MLVQDYLVEPGDTGFRAARFPIFAFRSSRSLGGNRIGFFPSALYRWRGISYRRPLDYALGCLDRARYFQNAFKQEVLLGRTPIGSMLWCLAQNGYVVISRGCCSWYLTVA